MHLKPKILVVNEDSRELLQLERGLEETGGREGNDETINC